MTSREIFETFTNQLNECKEYNPLVNPKHPNYKEFQKGLNEMLEKYVIQKFLNKSRP